MRLPNDRGSFDHLQQTNTPKQATLPIEFLIIGGGIAGLACAIALRRVGHRVVVLEKDKQLTHVSCIPFFLHRSEPGLIVCDPSPGILRLPYTPKSVENIIPLGSRG